MLVDVFECTAPLNPTFQKGGISAFQWLISVYKFHHHKVKWNKAGCKMNENWSIYRAQAISWKWNSKSSYNMGDFL